MLLDHVANVNRTSLIEREGIPQANNAQLNLDGFSMSRNHIRVKVSPTNRIENAIGKNAYHRKPKKLS